ncbi:transcriptional regulator [Cutibacterium sp. V947]|uniref:transcriptional regulator n=1 Tax=Cutibacterium sp. V947 TaxID=3446480 RepID=UPI003EE35170
MRAARAATVALGLIAAAAMTGCSHSDEGLRPATTQASSDVGVACDSGLAKGTVKPATVTAVRGWKGKVVTVCLMSPDGKVNESMEQTFSGDDDINDVVQGHAETAKDRPATCHLQKGQWTMVIDQSGKAWRLTPLNCVTAPGGSATPSDEEAPA